MCVTNKQIKLMYGRGNLEETIPFSSIISLVYRIESSEIQYKILGVLFVPSERADI